MHIFSRRQRWLWIIIFCIWVTPGWTYEFGLIDVPQPLAEIHNLLLSSPLQCLEQIDKHYHLDQDRNYGEEPRPVMIAQLAALCAHRAGIKSLSFEYAAQAIAEAKAAQQPSQLLAAHIINALILSESPDHLRQAESSLRSAQQQISGVHSVHKKLMSFELNRAFAKLYINQNDMSQAKHYLQRAKDIAYTSNSNTLKGWAEVNLGYYYLRLEQAEPALSHSANATLFASSEAPEFLLLRSKNQQHIAAIYQMESEVEKAIEHQNRAIQYAEQLGDNRLMATQVRALANIYQEVGDLNMALAYYLNAQDLANLGQDPFLQAQIEFSLGEAYLAVDELEAAMMHLNQARQLFKQNGSTHWLITTLQQLAETQIRNNEPGLAILQLEQATALAKASSYPQYNLIYNTMSRAYEQNGSYQQSLAQYKRYHELTQQVHQNRDRRSRAQFIQHYQYIEQAQQISDLSRDNMLLTERNHYQRLISTLLLVILLAATLAFLINRQRILRITAEANKLRSTLHHHKHTGWLRLDSGQAPLEILRELGDYPLGGHESVKHVVIALQFLGDFFKDKTLGLSDCQELELEFAQYFDEQLAHHFQVGHIGTFNYLLVTTLDELNSQEICIQLREFTKEFISKKQLQLEVAIGCCEAPFLATTNDAIDDKGIGEIAFLAQQGARQLVAKTNDCQWVELKALRSTQAAFFGDDLIQDVKQAISKGLVKVTASAERRLIQW